MNFIKQLDIRLNRDYFYPGELIEGKLVIDVVESFKLNVIHLLVRGKAHCEWKVFISGDRRVIKDDQYFIDERIVIWDSVTEEQQEQQPLSIPPDDHVSVLESPPPDIEDTRAVSVGFHEFHFSYQLPQTDVPCSLESRACSIRYHLRAILDVPGVGADYIPQGIKYFTMIGPSVNCNDNTYLNPLFGSEKRWRYCFCCRQQVASLRCILDRNAYSSGETIKLKSFIQNYSNETVKLKVRLVQGLEGGSSKFSDAVLKINIGRLAGEHLLQKRRGIPFRFCEFNAQKANLCGVTKEVQHLVLEYTSDSVDTNEELDLTTSHCLPILVPTIVSVCRLVQLFYTLTVCLEFENSGQDLQMLFPIKIGTKPFTGAQNDFTLEYGPCCDHVEGGIYVDPEFTNGASRFWDDGTDSTAAVDTPLYRPVYLQVVKCPPKVAEPAIN